MTAKNVVVIDYGIGNVFSVMSALERLGARGELTSEPTRIAAADRVILPGVGAFGRAANKLRAAGLDRVIHDYIETGKPFLGICVGMQLLMETGEEFGLHKGLGIIAGNVRRIEAHDPLGTLCRIPFIGWAEVDETQPGALHGTPFSSKVEERAFYFVHSYQVDVLDPTHRIAAYQFGDSTITAAVQRDNVLGVQFHPERSAESGQRFLKAFISDL